MSVKPGPGRSSRARRGTLAALVWAVMCLAHPLAGQESERPEVLPPDCEAELALSAAPAHLRDGAAVWVMGRDGYTRLREGSNGFACIVNRDDPHAIKPTCFDGEGAETMVPRIRLVGGLLLTGTPMEEIGRRLDEAFAAGELIRPRRTGVAYMLSPQNRPWNPATRELGRFPPHFMIYAPDLTNEEIGTSYDILRQTPGLPFVAYQGPHGFIIVVQKDLPPGEGDFSACPAWLTEE